MACSPRLVTLKTLPRHSWARPISGSRVSAFVAAASAAARRDVISSGRKDVTAKKSTYAIQTGALTLSGSCRSARSKKLRARARFSSVRSLNIQATPCKTRSKESGLRHLFRSARFGANEFRAELIGDPGDDLVLHDEEVGHWLVEPLRPKMTAALRLDELHVHPHSIAATLDAPLQRIADLQFAPDRPHVDRLTLECEGSAASDHERASDPRKVRGQAAGHAIDEIVLFGIAADIGEGQDDNGELSAARRARRPAQRMRSRLRPRAPLASATAAGDSA